MTCLCCGEILRSAMRRWTSREKRRGPRRGTYPPTSKRKPSGVTSVEARPPASCCASTTRKLLCFCRRVKATVLHKSRLCEKRRDCSPQHVPAGSGAWQLRDHCGRSIGGSASRSHIARSRPKSAHVGPAPTMTFFSDEQRDRVSYRNARRAEIAKPALETHERRRNGRQQSGPCLRARLDAFTRECRRERTDARNRTQLSSGARSCGNTRRQLAATPDAPPRERLQGGPGLNGPFCPLMYSRLGAESNSARTGNGNEKGGRQWKIMQVTRGGGTYSVTSRDRAFNVREEGLQMR
jgi:hypothetical protein